jgi:Ca2+-binding EF-hand superfamily protein
LSIYLASVLEDGGNKEWIEMDKRWLEEQKKEFHEMDENNDGVLTKEELLVKEFVLIKNNF